MAEEVEERTGETIGESVRRIRDEISPKKVDERLGEAVDERPLVKHLLSFEVVGIALAIAAVLTLLVALLLSPAIGAVVLVVSYFGAWYIIANRRYNRRKPTREADAVAE